MYRALGAETVYLTSGSYLASSSGVDVDTKWGGAKTFFSSEGLFLLKVTGPGDLFVSSYGAIEEIPLVAGQSHVVDSGHMVAFSDGVEYKVRKFAGWKSTLLGGEGLVVELTGPGNRVDPDPELGCADRLDRATLAVEGNRLLMSALPTRHVTEAGANHDEPDPHDISGGHESICAAIRESRVPRSPTSTNAPSSTSGAR